MSRSEMQTITSNLEDVGTENLIAELKRRGYDVLPAGLLQVALNDANRRTGDVREPTEDELESLATIGRIAGVDFPNLVKTHGTVLEANLELSRRALRAEAEVSGLIDVLLDDLFTSHGTTDETEGKEDE